MSVARLPVQHPRHPHCEGCGRDLPMFEDAEVFLPVTTAPVLAVKFQTRCACGRVYDIVRSSVKEMR